MHEVCKASAMRQVSSSITAIHPESMIFETSINYHPNIVYHCQVTISIKNHTKKGVCLGFFFQNDVQHQRNITMRYRKRTIRSRFLAIARLYPEQRKHPDRHPMQKLTMIMLRLLNSTRDSDCTPAAATVPNIKMPAPPKQVCGNDRNQCSKFREKAHHNHDDTAHDGYFTGSIAGQRNQSNRFG